MIHARVRDKKKKHFPRALVRACSTCTNAAALFRSSTYSFGAMAEGPNPAKKSRRSAPVSRVTAEERAKQFSSELYAEGGILFCKFCDHSLDFVRVDTIKDHLKSKKHLRRKDSKEATSSSAAKQLTIKTVIKSKDLREEFVLDFIKMATMADIPLEKVEKMKPFLQKHCRQAGTLSQASTLRYKYVPRVFEEHFTALKQVIKKSAPAWVYLTADETTDERDHNILNVLATIRGKSYLIGVVRMEACNHSTFSQAILKSAAEVELPFDRVRAIVSDSAAYCKKAYREVLSAVFPQSTHVLCLAHVVNLAAEVFQKHADFHHTSTLISMIKSSMYKKPGRKSRFISFLRESLAPADVKLPPVPVSTRWNSWFEAAIYHATRLHTYEGFYKSEKSKYIKIQHNTIYIM